MSCIVVGCKSHSSRKENDAKIISFHRFPSDVDMRQKLINAIARNNWEWKKQHRIWSKHFSDDCFNNIGHKWRRLKIAAVPSLHLRKEEFMSTEALIEKIIQLEAHNVQLKNIISKKSSDVDNNTSNNGRKKLQKSFDFTKCHFRRVLLRVLYFGWDYQGLAVQEHSTQTIEYHLFHALTKSCLIESREKSNYHRCGRTDKGVSSFGQVISISLCSKYPLDQQYTPDAISNEMPYCKKLNRLLPKDIRVVGWMPIPMDKLDLSARFDCKKRQYKYYFPRSCLNIDAMRSACKQLLGSNDYRNLCKMDVGNGITVFRREILKAEILPVSDIDIDTPTSMYYLLIEGNAFLWHQIRCIMGVLLLVGEEKERPEIITELLDIEKNPRKPQYSMALDLPLNLFQASYDLESNWVFDKDNLSVVIAQIQNEWTIKNIQSTMLKDVIQELERHYSNTCAKDEHTTEGKRDKDRIISYTECLTQGVKPKVYTPLLKRETCSSLEERIDYYAKRKKLSDPDCI